MPEFEQHLRGDAVARGNGVVASGLRSVQQRLVVVGGEVEPATGLVLEARKHGVGEVADEVEVGGMEAHLQQRQSGINQVDVVVEVGVEMRFSVLGCGQQPAVAPEMCAY